MTTAPADSVTLALAAAASPAEAAGLALAPADLVAAGHTLAETGPELAAAVRALPAAAAEQAARALTDTDDAEAVLAADRRKGVQLAVLAHAPLTLDTRRRMALKTRKGEVGLAMAAVDGATDEQAVALCEVWEDMAPQTVLRLSDRLSDSACRPHVVARLRAASPLGDDDVPLVRMARGWTVDLADLDLDPDCSDTTVDQLAGILTDPDAGTLQVATYTQLARRGLDVPSPAGLAAALDNGLDGALLADRAADLAIDLAAGRSHTRPPTLGAGAVAFVLAQQVPLGKVRVTVPALQALADAGQALRTGASFDLEIDDPDPHTEQVHLLVAALSCWPSNWQFAETDAVTAAVRTAVAADPGRLLELRRPPAQLVAEFADDPSGDLRSPHDVQADGVGQALADRARGNGVALTGAKLATTLRHLHMAGLLTGPELVTVAVDAVGTGRLPVQSVRTLLRQVDPPERLPALAALPVLCSDVPLLTDIPADHPDVTAPVVAAVAAHAPPSAACHPLVAHAVLVRLRGRAADAGRDPAEVLPTLAALLDGSWDGSLDGAVDAAVAVAPAAPAATATPAQASNR